MAAKFTQQYHPMYDFEAADDRAYSVRHIADQAASVNNFAAYAGAHKLISEIYPLPAMCLSIDDDTDEHIVKMWAPRRVAGHFTKINFQAGHAKTSGATGNTTWTLYASAQMYSTQGIVTTFDSAYFGVDWASAAIVSSSSTHAVSVATEITLKRRGTGLVWFLLTAQSASSGGANTGRLTTLDVTPAM